MLCYELVSGQQAQTGAKAELTTRAANRVTGMTETVENNSLPDSLAVIYETHVPQHSGALQGARREDLTRIARYALSSLPAA